MVKRFGRNRQLRASRGKTANTGFSLVELLIAVTILAIIAIPLLYLFVTSTKINMKSRQTLRATTVAQDIMEGLKAYSLDEVRTQFSLPDGSPGSSFFYPSEEFYIINSSMIQGGVREIIELETPRNADGGFADPGNPDNEIYYFGIQNLKMQGGEYDALIKLDASTYTEQKAGSPGAHDNDFNGAYYADVTSVSETSGGSLATDSSYHEDKDLSVSVIKDIKSQIENDFNTLGAELPAGWEDDWKDVEIEDITVKREILVMFKDAHDVDMENNPRCEAVVTFTYTCKYDGAPDPSKVYTSHGLAGSSGGEVNGITRTFSSGNFYLFYYPIYKAGSRIDDITFEIQDVGILFNESQPMLKSITLAKQIRSVVDETSNVIAPDMTDSYLWEAENSYRAIVNIEPSGNSAVSDNLVFRTNIDLNMSPNAKNVDPFDGSVYWDELPWGQIVLSMDPEINKVDLLGDNVSNKATDVIYDIEITVYKTGAAEHFASANNPDFDHMEGVEKLATITNFEE